MKKKKKIGKKIIVGLMLLCSVGALAVSGYKILEYLTDANEAKTIYDDTQDAVFVITDDTDYDYFDFDALLTINEYAIGWIKQEDGSIDYPIVQYTDNSYYLKHAIDGTYSQYGTIFADYRISDGLNAHMCILWGHNMKNGTMFGMLSRYKNEDYYENHKYFTIWIGSEKYRYKVFACGYEDVDSSFFTYSFSDNYTLEDWLEDRSNTLTFYDTATENLTAEDYIISLVTCVGNNDYSQRFVVLLRRVE